MDRKDLVYTLFSKNAKSFFFVQNVLINFKQTNHDTFAICYQMIIFYACIFETPFTRWYDVNALNYTLNIIVCKASLC